MRASGLLLQHFLADGLKQMRLAQPDAAVNEQRVVRLPGLLGDGDATPRAAGGCTGRSRNSRRRNPD